MVQCLFNMSLFPYIFKVSINRQRHHPTPRSDYIEVHTLNMVGMNKTLLSYSFFCANVKQSNLQFSFLTYIRILMKDKSFRTHSRYEADARYLCVPSRDEVFKLLVGLHENRNGNHQRTVNFCNRKRPAKAIFTNIRFLG